MRTFISRLLSTVLFLGLVAFTIFVAPAWFFSSVAIALIGLALYEFYTMVEKKELFVYSYFGMALGILVPFCVHFRIGGLTQDLEPISIIIICLLTVMVQLTRRDNSEALKKMSVTLFGILYISWFFSFIIKLRFLPAGPLLCAFLIVVTKGGDIGAYIVGSLAGRHILIRRISPKKSVEGLIGGLLFSFTFALLFKPLFVFVPYFHMIILGLLLGMLGQLGDLSESLIKRDCGVKDTGAVFPGLGGALDVLDSLLFTTPIFYFYVRFFF